MTTTVNVLDGLLSIWIAEAILESEPRDARRPTKRMPQMRAAEVARPTDWLSPDAP